MGPGDDPAGGYPACGDVWVAGQALPDGYEGCYDAERDTIEMAAAFVCADGSELSSYQDHWWVLGDGEIADAGEDGTVSNPDYGAADEKCSA